MPSNRCSYGSTVSSMHVYEVRPRKDHRGVDLISDAPPFGRLWYAKPDDAIGYAMHGSRSHAAVIRVYDNAGHVIVSNCSRQPPFALTPRSADHPGAGRASDQP